MSKRNWICLGLVAVLGLTFWGHRSAFGIGGRGGGGGFGGGGGGRMGGGGFSGGGGMARPSAPARPSVGSSPAMGRPGGGARPAGGAGAVRPATRPSTGAGAGPRPGTRPNIGAGAGAGAGSRGGLQPGSRPNIGAGAGPGTRPSTRPGTGIGAGQGIGSGAGIGTRPAAGTGIANGGRPGAGQQPARLPGLGQGGAGTRLPNQGAGVSDRMANRGQSVQDRQASLSDRMQSGREDRQGNRGDRQDDRQQNRGDRQDDRQQGRSDRQDDRQDWRDQNREDWQDFADDHHNHYGNWYNDSWYPGAGWNYMWDNYPVAAALGVTAWGVNRLAYGFGYSDYSNPYSGGGGGGGGSYDYSEPLVSYAEPAAGTAPAEDPAPAAEDPGMQAFDDARNAFLEGDSQKALSLLDTTLKTMPRDTVVHEFRSLVLFSLKRYPESAAALYAVLSAGPGWDWTTMIGLYPNADAYTQQLRALEAFARENPKSPDARFLLGYHYMTGNHSAEASKQFKLAQEQLPDDKLIAQLVKMTTPPDAAKADTPAPAAKVVPEEKVLSVDKMVGTWKASTKDAQFQLDLAKDGQFTWSFTRGKDKQSVKGAFAVDQNNLALEPDAGGTMVAEVDMTSPSQFHFQMIGGDAKDPGLDFKKSE